MSAGPRLSLSTQMNVYIVSLMFVLMTHFIYVVKFSDATNRSLAVSTVMASVNLAEGASLMRLCKSDNTRTTQARPKFLIFFILTFCTIITTL